MGLLQKAQKESEKSKRPSGLLQKALELSEESKGEDKKDNKREEVKKK